MTRTKGPYEPRIQRPHHYWQAGAALTTNNNEVIPYDRGGVTRLYETRFWAKFAAIRMTRWLNREWRKQVWINNHIRMEQERKRWHKP